MNANKEEFGKDLGLMGEVVVTGRKAGMSKASWAFLAHNELEFSFLAPLIEHWAVIKQNNAEVKSVSREDAEKLIQTVGIIAEADSCECLHCGSMQKRRHLHHLYVPAEILTIDCDKRRQCVDGEAAIEIMHQKQEVEYQKYFYQLRSLCFRVHL